MEQARTSSISTSPVMMIASNTCPKSNGKMTLLYVHDVAIHIIAKDICLMQDDAPNANMMKARRLEPYLIKSGSLFSLLSV